MINFVCIDSDNYCGRGKEYVQILRDSLGRSLPEGYPGRFIVFSDYCDDYGPEAVVRPLTAGLNGWYNKLWLFRYGQFADGDRVLFLDLDTVITGKLDDIVEYKDEFAILRDFYRPNGYQSSVMMWRANANYHIWDSFAAAGCPEIPGGDQAWIERTVHDAAILQEIYPDRFVSFKVHARKVMPKGASVCVFHGHPRPHEVLDGWVPQVWKIGGGTTAVLESVCNTDGDRILSNIRHSSKLDLPWLEKKEPRKNDLCVIAGGGPSLPEGLKEVPQDAPFFGLNNAARWLKEHGIDRIAQVILDARPEMKEMVESAALIHLFASQCDPSLFEIPDTNVTLFHPNFPGLKEAIGPTKKPMWLVGGGSTVGLQAMVIAYIMGYRRIHLIGMDSSYRDGEGHAYKQSLNDGEKILNVTVAGKTFKAAPWMAQQAEEFQVVCAELANLGCEIVAHGDGLIPTIAQEMAREHLFAEAGIIEPDGSPADLRALSVVRRITGISRPIGAEIGVFRGQMSRRLLGYLQDLTLYMVDSWKASDPDGQYARSGDYHARLAQEDQDRYCEEAKGNVAFAGERAKIIRAPSVEAAQQIPDGSLDFVFIDADHSYEGCCTDINAWRLKLKPTGILCGHDYGNRDFPGFCVDRAVDEFARRNGLKVELGDNFTWFLRLPLALSPAA